MTWLKNNRQWVFSGVGVAVITTTVGFIWQKPSPEKEVVNNANADDNSTVVQVGGDASNININSDDKKDIRNFKKFVPQTYLSNLPKVKYNAYIESHEYWDTGITSEMQKGSYLLSDQLLEILIELSETAYTEDFFEGQSTADYYNEKISRLTKASHDSQPRGGGTMHVVMASGEMSDIVDEFVVKIVKDVADEDYFPVWKKKWDRAGELGAEGKEVNLDLTDEL